MKTRGIHDETGVFTVLFAEKSFEEMLDYVKEAGLHSIEIGTGCYPGNSHCDLDLITGYRIAEVTI